MRAIQTVTPGKWEEKVEIEKRFQPVEARLGSAAVRHYRCIFGAEPHSTYVKESEYDDLAALQKIGAKFGADPEKQALLAEAGEKGMTIEERSEIYRLLD